MDSPYYCDIIRDETDRALWEVGNVVACVPDTLWDTCYCGMPVWKHIYHMLHSLDQWYINPMVYAEPPCQRPGLNSLDVPPDTRLSRPDIGRYFAAVSRKITAYDDSLTDAMLRQKPENCRWTRFELILGQYRHLHSHMGMLMGFIIAATGRWPQTLGLTHDIPAPVKDGQGVYS